MRGEKKEKKKWSKKKKIIVGVIIGILVLGALGSGEDETPTADKDTSKPVASEKKETAEDKAAREQKEKEEKAFQEEEVAYGNLFAEGKTYSTLSEDEQSLFRSLTKTGKWNYKDESLSKEERDTMVEKYESLSNQFKDKYRDRYNSIKAEYDAVKYDTGITWEDIARNGLEGQFCKFEGKIIQVMNGEGYKQYRVAINNDYDKVMLVEIKNGLIDTNLLEDDVIFFKGYSYGNVTYKTVLGAEQSIPAVVAEHVELK